MQPSNEDSSLTSTQVPSKSNRKAKRQKIDDLKDRISLVHPFNGMILAVSACQRQTYDQQRHINSYNSIVAECKAGGAIVTGQVHRRVNGLICNKSSLEISSGASQRVRKALKICIDIIDVSWVRDCVQQGKRLSPTEYLLNDMAKRSAESAKEKKRNESQNEKYKSQLNEMDDEKSSNALRGWSKPILLECCCVCHENGHLDCPWCVECSFNYAGNEK